MKNTILILISLAVLGVSIYFIVNLAPQFLEKIGPKTGLDKVPLAPDFRLTNLEGGTVKLSDLRGKNVILGFWTSWNEASINEIKILNDYRAHYAPKSMEIIAIDSEEAADIATKIRKDNDFSLGVLLDEEGAVGELYNVGALPLTVFIDKSGLQVNTVVGPMTLKEIEDEIAKLN